MKKLLLTLGLVSLLKLANAQIFFSPAVSYSVNTYPFGVTTGNFNSDNIPDIAVANRGSNNVSVLLNSGTGTFATAVSYTVGSVPVALASADFNGDGHVDIVTCNNFDNSISILKNTGSGTGTFTAQANYTVGTSPTGIATGDFNGDNKPDIAVVNNGTNNISILLNTGTGAFAAPVNYAAGNSPFRISVANFNNDAAPDIAVSSYGNNSVAVLLNTGTGTFSAQTTYSAGVQPYGISSGDFNNDGKTDIVTANISGGNLVYVLTNAGAGFFNAAVTYTVGSNPYDVSAADFNADGNVDIVAANYNDNNVSVLLNTGTGTFGTQTTYTVDVNPTALSTADFNNDGRADIVSANSNSNSTSVINSLLPAAALNFDGVDDYVFATAVNESIFTLEAAVNWTGPTATNQAIVSNGKSGSSGYTVIVDKGNSNKLSVTVGGFPNMLSTAHLTIGTWQMVSVVYNGSTWILYLDGVPYTLTNNTPVPHTIISGNFNVGCDYNATKTFSGSIDEVRFWSRALCKEEIQNNLNGELPLPQNGLVIYYKFNQGIDAGDNSTLTTLNDNAGVINNNATLSNFALTGATSNWVKPGYVTTGSTVATFSNTLSAVATQTDVSTCYGDANGIASVAVTGIESPFTYTWSVGSVTTNSVTNLAAGNYTCTIGNGCGTIAQTFTIIAPPPLFAVSTANTIPCYGGIATATVLASGGTQFSGGPTTPIYNGIGTYTVTAGVHTFTVTDAHNCATTTTLTTNEPTLLVASSSAGTILCNGGVTTVTVSATGGTFPYFNDGTISNVTAGSYTYTVTDGFNCPATTTVTITQPNAITTTHSPTICAGGSVTVGTHTYTTAATYTDVLAAHNGCDSTVTTTLTVNQITAAFTYTLSSANNQVFFQDSSYYSSGNSVNTYSWSVSGSGQPVQTYTVQSPVINITYPNTTVCLKVTSVNGCTDSICKPISQVFTGINQYNNTPMLTVYPNPFSNELTIVSTAKTNALLFDMLGNKINEFVLQNTTQTISLGELTPGMYYLQVNAQKIKIIKQ